MTCSSSYWWHGSADYGAELVADGRVVDGNAGFYHSATDDQQVG